jgi:hypothetical protein
MALYKGNGKVGVEKSYAAHHNDLHDDATCTLSAEPPPVLRLDWETLARRASRWSKPLDLDVCPALSLSSHRFCGAIDKP